MSQGEGKSSRELFKKVRVNTLFFLVFRDFGWVLGPLLFCARSNTRSKLETCMFECAPTHGHELLLHTHSYTLALGRCRMPLSYTKTEGFSDASQLAWTTVLPTPNHSMSDSSIVLKLSGLTSDPQKIGFEQPCRSRTTGQGTFMKFASSNFTLLFTIRSRLLAAAAWPPQ